ncbi:NapC/NirT family cytochrome c [Yersinia massiliensis]|jgi:trimethylamine-N-oxide reductase (cytochrome c) cytochrome c-type subunit TorY|uniref:Cytochrome c-type protein n=3 Tax=Yersinia TaxID=629 RepID=A0AAI8ZR58_YERFR|nr:MULTISPECIES: NapC/NirT family cytochrome c [Yersinia]HEI6965124.1 NapC/NirT family cytochrome c [Yersinia enterocolitica]ATM86737.1 cytochrome C [Yersinia frederiksenii]MCB5318097.1 NapC/NirT family cytochrome c [Yersinia massiliensis]MDA5546273.1 NapC/NirT family cytochrome c [Yersinia massiliensis]MDN0127455.1 NapC/NirT family cytochrome c [Yersinia massiliensis]
MAIKKTKIFILIFIGIVLGIIGFSGGSYVLHKTSETSFCLSCHTMQAPYDEYQASIHFKNQKGIRAECSDCHIPKAPLDFIIAKIKAGKDVYHQFITGSIDTPEKFEEQRLAMAQTVWQQLKENDSATCRSCHQFDAMDLAAQSADAQKMHNLAIKEQQTCIDCHKGIAHFPPEIKMDDKALDELMALAKQTSAEAKEVYPVQPVKLGDFGTAYPATALQVLNTDGTQRKIVLSGVQMKGAEQVIYIEKGQRLILASLTEQGEKALKINGEFTKDEYDNQWRPVTLTATITEPVLSDRQPLWGYAENLDNVYCSGCHAKISSKHYTVNAWPAVAKGMGARTDITPQDLDILTKYFQYNAKDINSH